MKIDRNAFKNDFKCPICLDIIQEAVVIPECFHRFCKTCLERALEIGNHECPNCRIHTTSKRSLRKDTHFDSLIQLIYPDLEVCKQQEIIEEQSIIRECSKSSLITFALQKQRKKNPPSPKRLFKLDLVHLLDSDSSGSESKAILKSPKKLKNN